MAFRGQEREQQLAPCGRPRAFRQMVGKQHRSLMAPRRMDDGTERGLCSCGLRLYHLCKGGKGRIEGGWGRVAQCTGLAFASCIHIVQLRRPAGAQGEPHTVQRRGGE